MNDVSQRGKLPLGSISRRSFFVAAPFTAKVLRLLLARGAPPLPKLVDEALKYPQKVLGLSRTGFGRKSKKFVRFDTMVIVWQALPGISIKMPKPRVCTVAIKPGREETPPPTFVATALEQHFAGHLLRDKKCLFLNSVHHIGPVCNSMFGRRAWS